MSEEYYIRKEGAMSVMIFDGDDTLWHVEWRYSQAYADFFAFLYRVLGHYVPDLHSVYQVFFAIEGRNAKTYGVNRGRVAASMLETYHKVAEEVEHHLGDRVRSAKHEDEIRRIGDIPFDVSKHYWSDGAEQVLAELAARGHTLCLLTKYDQNVWPEKAQHLGTKRFFADDHIVCVSGRKTPGDFEDLANYAGASSLEMRYTVGNSEGDMVPVLHGDQWFGFYIPRMSTVLLENDKRPADVFFSPAQYEHKRVRTLPNLPSILSHLIF